MVSSKIIAAALATGVAASPVAWSDNTTTTTYACNPAHQYPTGQVCTTVSGSLTLVTLTESATPSATTYACNPAHQYPAGEVCTEVSGSLTLVTTTEAATASATASSTGSSASACSDAYNKCRQPTNGLSANQAYCASQYAACLGYNPFASNATNTVTPAVSMPDVYVTQVVTAFTTYCPSATTLTYNQTTYTVSSATTLTITDCPCKMTTPVQSLPQATTVTAVVPYYTTVCPAPPANQTTTYTIGSETYTVSKSTTITVSCSGGCTITTPVSKIPVTSAPVPSTTETTILATPYSTGQGVVPGTPMSSTIAAVSATSSRPALYTGAASKLAGSGAMLIGALGLFVL